MSLGRKRSRRIVVCLRCDGHKLHEARGLCKCCYNHLAEGRCRSGESLDDYPPLGGYGSHAGVTSVHDPLAIADHEEAVTGPKSASQILADHIRAGVGQDTIDHHTDITRRSA